MAERLTSGQGRNIWTEILNPFLFSWTWKLSVYIHSRRALSLLVNRNVICTIPQSFIYIYIYICLWVGYINDSNHPKLPVVNICKHDIAIYYPHIHPRHCTQPPTIGRFSTPLNASREREWNVDLPLDACPWLWPWKKDT